jgi:sulfite oxidase
MKKQIGLGLLTGVILTVPLTAVLYLADQWVDLPFPPFDIFNWMVRVLPGPLITFGIDLMIDSMLLFGLDVANVAKAAERAMAVLQFIGGGAAMSSVAFVILSRVRASTGIGTGLLIGALFGFPVVAISLSFSSSTVNGLVSVAWLVLAFLVWGVGLSMAFSRLNRPQPIAAADEQAAEVIDDAPEAVPSAAVDVQRVSRRQFLITMGGSAAAVTVVGAGVGSLLARQTRRSLEAEQAATMAHNSEGSSPISFPNATDALLPAPGTRPEYTPLKDHYKVFLDTEPLAVPAEGYMLPISGLVDNPVNLTLDQIYDDFESFDQFVTLSCISGRVGTTLISTTQWTGISMQDILDHVGTQSDAQFLLITSADGFHESVPLDMIRSDPRIMLCHSWDGNPLPSDHGFPLRIWLPDRFGMKQPKWIVSMELSAEDKDGYWVQRGWDAIAQVKTTSVIDTVAVDTIVESGTVPAIPIGGIAWGGDRQISKVEVRVNNGPWMEAQLRQPLSETTWVIWRFDWPFEAGEHIFDVRTYEADGTPQIEAIEEARPSGSTGYHHELARVGEG